MSKFLRILILGLFLGLAYSQMDPAPRCPEEGDTEKCELPSCRCSIDSIGYEGIDVTQIPQFVLLTFDDAITTQNFPMYDEEFFTKTNPNGAGIGITYFVCHEYTDYGFVHQLWRKNHQISLHSMTHTTNTSYWANLNAAQWVSEVVEQREQLARFAAIPEADIKGFRAPFLQPGGNTMYQMLNDRGFEWDCSLPSQNYANDNGQNLMWPYTRDYESIQDCLIEPCPQASFKGFWTVPMLAWKGLNDNFCSMFDFCQPLPENENELLQLFRKNFNRHYNGNRAPFGMFGHSAYFSPLFPGRIEGLRLFLAELLDMNDVYFVTVGQMLEWMKNPVPLSAITASNPAYLGVKPDKANGCLSKTSCHYPPGSTPFPSERYMSHCYRNCPSYYPWLNNKWGEIPN